jgi:hypothetical protein
MDSEYIPEVSALVSRGLPAFFVVAAVIEKDVGCLPELIYTTCDRNRQFESGGHVIFL